ncbi:HD domain-containing protein [Treponema endosymbiont of Eucomonympha sp.]|uniref:HD domain-containing protein n=1 Tax=Treponema endosymbiont of Eucomonympha sp. TaxID=1580831 RepID=UPI000786762E|nr:HD domain-containing protein [Treponema endosymbiont of Eucomonympha sp.]
MLNAPLALKLFEGFSIERWNDLIRPFALIEMDKAAEKMALAYIIGKFEEERGGEIDWDWAMHAALFELFRKIALCDIKSPVQRMIKSEFPGEYRKLNEWALEQYRPLLGDGELFGVFAAYLAETAGSAPPQGDAVRRRTARVLRAAHKFSTFRELEMISTVNEAQRLEKIRGEIWLDIDEFLDLRGVQKLITRQRPFRFLLSIEQLRFQIRWNQTPRVPKTSVLGHSFFVAALTLLLGRGTGVSLCPKRRFNNFFSALFHDLPEAVTRDIISPVKQATDGLSAIIKTIEGEVVAKELLPLMENFYADELLYFIGSEFDNRILEGGKTRAVPFEELNARYNDDRFSPVDGMLIRLADHIATFMEADLSIKYGITSPHLVEGRKTVLEAYQTSPPVSNFDIAGFLAQVQ